MSRDRMWEVACPDWKHTHKVYATSRLAAVRIVRKEKRVPAGTKLIPHLWDCQCEDLFEPCLNASIEEKLKGTRLGRLCSL